MAYHPSLWKNFTATYYDYESFTDLTAQSLTDRGICSVRLSWRRLLRESKKYRVRRNIKLTKLFSKCATSPSVKILYVDEWDIVDNIKEHLPVKSDTLECLTLFPHIYDDYVLRDILKPLVSLQQLVISNEFERDETEEQFSATEMPLSNADYLAFSLDCLPELRDLEIDMLDDDEPWAEEIPIGEIVTTFYPKMERLIFKGSNVCISSQDLIVLAQRFPNLKYFGMRDSMARESRVMSGVNFKHVVGLRLASVTTSSPFDLNTICNNFPHLLALDITNGIEHEKEGLLDKHLHLLTKKVPNLAYLCVEGHKKITPDAVCEVVCQLPELQVLIVDYSTFSEETQVDRLLASIEANAPKLYSVLQVQWLKTKILQSPSKIKYVNWSGKQAHTIKRANLVLYSHIAMKTISQYGSNQITPLRASSAAYKAAIGEKFFKREESLLFSE